MATALSCPRCLQPLTKTTSVHGVFWSCAACGGKALGVDVLRRTFARDQINAVWRRAREGEGSSGPACPSCHNAMIEVAATPEQDPRIDVCLLCHFLWFDADELARLSPAEPKKQAAEPELSPEAKQALAILEAQQMARRVDRQVDGERNIEVWRQLAELLGSTVDIEPPLPSRAATVWWVLSAALAGAVVAAILRLLR